MKPIFYFLFFILIALTSCTSETEQIFEADKIYIRLKNTSNKPIKNTIFNNIYFGKVRKDKVSNYEKSGGFLIYDMNNPHVNFQFTYDNEIYDYGTGFCATGTQGLEAGQYTVEVYFFEGCSAETYCYPTFKIIKDF